MMMPANFSVVAENEMTYVVGGGVIEAIGSVTAPIWTAANVKTFNTNLVTIIGFLSPSWSAPLWALCSAVTGAATVPALPSSALTMVVWVPS